MEKCGVWEIDLKMVAFFFFLKIRECTPSVLMWKTFQGDRASSSACYLVWFKYPENLRGLPSLGHSGLGKFNRLLCNRTSQSLYWVMFSGSFQEEVNTLILTRGLCLVESPWPPSPISHLGEFWPPGWPLGSALISQPGSGLQLEELMTGDRARSQKDHQGCQHRERPKSDSWGKSQGRNVGICVKVSAGTGAQAHTHRHIHTRSILYMSCGHQFMYLNE